MAKEKKECGEITGSHYFREHIFLIQHRRFLCDASLQSGRGPRGFSLGHRWQRQGKFNKHEESSHHGTQKCPAYGCETQHHDHHHPAITVPWNDRGEQNPGVISSLGVGKGLKRREQSLAVPPTPKYTHAFSLECLTLRSEESSRSVKDYTSNYYPSHGLGVEECKVGCSAPIKLSTATKLMDTAEIRVWRHFHWSAFVNHGRETSAIFLVDNLCCDKCIKRMYLKVLRLSIGFLG